MNTATDTRKPDLLIVDDDPLISDTLNFVLSRDFNVCVADSRAQARSLLRQLDQPPQLALIDLGLPPSPHRPDEGFRLISELMAYAPEMKIVVLSGQSDETNARHARTLGAIDFVSKPADPVALKQLLLQTLQVSRAEKTAAPRVSLLGRSAPVEKLRLQIAQFAGSPFPVLVQGESGSGKELIAQALHDMSPRATRALYALNCAAIAPTLVEPLPAPPRRARATSKMRANPRCFSTKLANCRWSCNRSSCACWKTASFSV
jgi:DNA-binding NtrC family response regulator